MYAVDIDCSIHMSGSKFYRHNETRQRHRLDGPAIEFANGTNHWYLYDIQYSFEEWAKEVGWTDEQIVMYKLENF